MIKLFANILCSFVPNKKKRNEVRNILLNKVIPPCSNACTLVNINDDINRYLQTTIHYNNEFLQYKNAFAGKEVVLVGAGPTLDKYIPIENAIHIGTNRVHQNKKIKLNFLFRQDFKNFDKEIFDCDVKKFIGNYFDWKLNMCPESVFNRLKNAHKFIIDNYTDKIPVDISKMPLWHGGSVAYSAMQFALWTNPERIYIVGCDSAGQKDPLNWNHYDDDNKSLHNQTPIKALVDGWLKIAEFAQTMYPDVEIISINPVGLKGLFKDIYMDCNI